MLLLYVPFRREEELTQAGAPLSPKSPLRRPGAEGLYDRSQSDYFTRRNEEGEINKFAAQVFGNKTAITYAEYAEINSNVSSEMFTSMMRVLHACLPCSKNFFHMKRVYRARLGDFERETSAATQASSAQAIKAIASPRLVRGLSIGKSPGRRGAGEGSDADADSPIHTGEEQYQSRFQSTTQSQFSNRMPDVRVKKNMNP